MLLDGSPHAVPAAVGVTVQVEVPLQVRVPHASLVHVIAVPPHVPPVHTSEYVHAFPSSQVLPFALGGFEQTPVAGLHVPAS